MAKARTPEEVSTYYPPRARWHSPILSFLEIALRQPLNLSRRAHNSLNRRLVWEGLGLPREAEIGELVAGLFVPGLAAYFRGTKKVGRAALAASASLLAVFIVFVGYAASAAALGLLIAIHSTGLAYYCIPLMEREPLRVRLAFTSLLVLALFVLVYWPAGKIASGCVAPLQMRGQVVVVRRVFQKSAVRRGDWVAYSLRSEGAGHGPMRIVAGMGMGPVLAGPGDRVEFSRGSFSVNGVPRPSLPHMPVSGGLAVPEKHCFIWPDLAISGHGDVGEANISNALLTMASVNEAQFYGRPFERWFFRKQILQ